MVWTPNVTVAALIEREGRFLLVEEDTERGRLINQPAGHLEPGESLIDGVARETLEELRREPARHRSPLVMRCIDDYLAGRSYPFAVLHHHPS